MVFIFTYGSDHEDEKGKSLFKRFSKIEAPNSEIARAIMFAIRGNKWSMQYNDDPDAAHMIEKYHLTQYVLPVKVN